MAKILNVISVSINGETLQFDTSISIAVLLDQLQLGNKRIALERNSEIVPRSQFIQQMLSNGDRLEIVVAVGGG